MDVKSFKLIGGQELVAEFLGETGLGYRVRRPLVVHVLRTPDGQGQLAFAQWSMVQDPAADIELFDTGLHCPPVNLIPEIAKSYAEQVTGLALPQARAGRILTG